MKCLEESINNKWIPIVEGRHKPYGAVDCVCCDLYIGNNCKGCPIKEDTGMKSCFGTPYEHFEPLHSLFIGCYSDDPEYCQPEYGHIMLDLKSAAQWELDYLIDLNNRLGG